MQRDMHSFVFYRLQVDMSQTKPDSSPSINSISTDIVNATTILDWSAQPVNSVQTPQKRTGVLGTRRLLAGWLADWLAGWLAGHEP